ncbi:MAG: hypothetical protein OZSIB_2203 [Candidatus Ozemobacter sibiricus]|uniref:DUF4382 domain-containing protein n=1 Tax=Candidatus Ozemobacter sibiricus TaxID=2268124 RepID=A0A367ZT65_9BACT|nr:MAG: hypothetical protein OZSIB_2203 [Candidatus Ozemobacter sibiricus]
MRYTSRSAILLATLVVLPFVAGCFTSGGGNPLAVNPTMQEESVLLAEAVPAEVAGAKVMAKSGLPSVPARKYSYAAPPHQCRLKAKEGLGRLLGGRFRLRFHCKSVDNLYLVLKDAKVKQVSGKPFPVPLPPKEIDLKSPEALSLLLAELELPPGSYNYLEFRVESGRVVESGKSYPVKIPSNRIRFLGKFEIKDGYDTELTIKFMHTLVRERGKHKDPQFILIPIVRISSTLVPRSSPPAVTTGDISGSVGDYVKKTPLSGVMVALTGPVTQSATTDAAGTFSFKDLPPGNYSLSLAHPDYLDKSFTVEVAVGQVSEVQAEMNPAVIQSSVANTGWFSERYPLADAKGLYGEVALETPVTIDFVSLAFTKVELAFEAAYHAPGIGRFHTFLSSSQQVQIITNLGGWWVGNNATLGQFIGEYYSTTPATRYVVNVTDYVRNNPSSFYYLAAKNLSLADLQLSNIQMTIYYR